MIEKQEDTVSSFIRKKIFDSIFLSLCAGLTFFHLYTGTFGLLENFLQMFIHLSFIFLIIFLLPFRNTQKFTAKKFISIVALAITVLCMGYLLLNYEYLTVTRYPFVTDLNIAQIVLGILFLLILLEGSRRTVGIILPILCILTILYAIFGFYAPGILKHSGKTIHTVLDITYLSTTGTFGLPLYISASYLVLFVIFGSLLNQSGLGSFLMDISKAIGGKFPGGPAKIAVFSSGAMGMVSGSPVANVVTTGTMTIPLMIKTGYPPHLAGAIESIASTGGMIMPPLMGILAFLMSEFTSIPYITICKYAILPAILYYFSIYLIVHFEAKKMGLKGLPKDEIPNFKETMKNGWHMLIPIFVLLYLLIRQFTPMYAIVYSIYSVVIVSFLRKSTRLNFRKIIKVVETGATASLMVGVACAIAGLIGGILSFTGLPLKLSSSICTIVGNHSMLLLFMTAGIVLLMGTGLPSTVCYIVLLPLVVPAMKAMGFSEVGSHLFVIYWATLSFITPPVGLAFFAASAISGASVMKTGISAVRIGLVAFIIPFLFVYFPALLMIGPVHRIILTLLTAGMGVYCISVGLTGFWYTKLGYFHKILAFSSAMLLLIPGFITDVPGILVMGGLFFMQKRLYARSKRTKADLNPVAVG